MLSLFRYKTKTRIRGIIECFFLFFGYFSIFDPVFKHLAKSAIAFIERFSPNGFLLVCLFFFFSDQRMVSMMKFAVVIGERGACTDESHTRIKTVIQ